MLYKFVAMINYQDRILCLTEEGTLFEVRFHDGMWSMITEGPIMGTTR
jgi:hypothetical protein